MTSNIAKDIISIGLCLLIGMVLVIVPLPSWMLWWRPLWVFMFVVFFISYTPHRVGVGIAWVMGLLVDLLTGTLLGQHAFAFALIAYLLFKFHTRLRVFPVWQQSAMIFILSMLNLALQYWIMGFIGSAPLAWLYWVPAITSAIVWPVVGKILTGLRLSAVAA